MGGLVLIVVGAVLLLVALVAPGFWTAVWRWGNVTVVFPLGLSIILSLVLTLVLNLLLRLR